jgi:hypothetical protein
MTDRTETEVVSDVIVELARSGYLSKPQMRGVIRLLGVNADDVAKAARARAARDHYIRPTKFGRSDRDAEIAEAELRPTDRRKRPKLKRRHQIDIRGDVWLYCPRCEPASVDMLLTMSELRVENLCSELPGAWHPEGSFIPKSTTGNRRHFLCDDCRKRYQKERRVTSKALESMASVGLAMHLDDESNVIGVCCKSCGDPFVAGDHVVGEATMYHDGCAPEELSD